MDRRWGIFVLVAVMSGLVVGVPAQAREDAVFGSRYTSARAAGMADAFLPLADDAASALFYNPAGIARFRKVSFDPWNITLQSTTDYLSQLDLGAIKVTNLKNYSKVLETKNNGKTPGVGAALLPAFSLPNFAVGLLGQSTVSAKYVDGKIEYRSRYQFIPAAGFGLRLASGVVRLGYSVQWVNQASGAPSVLNGSTPLGYNEGLLQGAGFSHTVGVAFTLPYQYLPSFNLVGRNLLGLHYSSSVLYKMAPNPVGIPADEPTTFDGSFSMEAKLGMGASANYVLEYRDITNQSNISILTRLAFGMEFLYRNQYFFRAGFGSGYPAVGIGFKQGSADLGITWFTEELGSRFRDHGESRILLQYQVRAF